MAEVNTVVALRTRQKDVMSTQRDVDRARPRARRYSVLDASLPGFLLRVSPNGARAYYVRTRIGKGRGARETFILVGNAELIGIREAREKAKAILLEAKSGVDPVRRKAPGDQIAEQLDQYEKGLRARGVVKRSEVMHSLRTGLGQHRKEQLADLDRATLSRVIDRLDTKGLPGAAAYFRKSASAFLNWAVNTGRLHASPLAGYRREKTTRRQQVAAKRFTIKTEEGIRHFWQATECANSPIQRDYLRFLLITGQRRTETALMCWTDVDLAKGIWEIPLENSKMGVPHTVYLDASSLALLKAQPRFAKHDLVFPGRNLRPMSGWSKIIMPVKEAFGNPALSLHALRRTYRTMLSELGVDEDIAERMIGHQRPALVSAYDKSQMVERRKTTQARYEARIWEIVG